ncbi:glycosyl transferase group 1 [Sulfolobus islandicus Y.G.57.14]|uniref:Glycosyl transferase group 1 n=1 Tax=Saccharolobus islandicus (strain Y.G.57.14 / Yellowstone \|nr:glycosyltransferase family 4 protein [Sulfolobus islandicus]ACP44913.1 glycosyl transferase group 1 [Sulfolobus islandicus Y.G.57.14]
MKISFVLITTSLAGGVRYVFEVANGLKNRGYNVKILSLAGDHSWFKGLKVEVVYKEPIMNKISKTLYNLYKVYNLIKLKNSKIKPYDSLLIFNSLLGIKSDLVVELAEFIQNFDSDITIATYYLTAFSVWFSQSKRPLYLMQDFPELVENNEGKIGLNMFKLSLKLPFSFVTVSSYTKQLILDNNPTARVTIANPGVNLEVFRPKRELQNDNKRRVMLILRGQKQKGDNIGLEVLKIVNKKIPIHAIIVGSKNLVKTYSKTIGIDFSYTVFSNVDDEKLSRLYSSADAFIFTSYAEGFGLPPLEAMACGTPVVMSDNKGSRDYAVNGYNALVSQPGDVKSLSDNLIKVLQDDKLREKLIENGLETAKRFTWSSTVNNFEKALREEIP